MSNQYTCPKCGTEWFRSWTSRMMNEEARCPECFHVYGIETPDEDDYYIEQYYYQRESF